MKRGFLLALDQGTTGSRALIYDANARVVSSAYQEFPQYYPKPGWVEHDPQEIWQSILDVIQKSLDRARIKSSDIHTVGIANQRETVVLWNKFTGKPYGRAIVWQDRRTLDFCKGLKKKRLEKKISTKTGLVLDPYFSATKIQWMLKNIPGLRLKARQGHVLAGTMDSWLLWKLTKGSIHATDFTNASRTLLFNIRTKQWDPDLLRIFRIPKSLLPEVKDSAADYGKVSFDGWQGEARICSLVGDQQAALYGQSCCQAGEAKNTYGTGCFLLMNIGKKFHIPPKGLLTTLACDRDGKSVFAFEGAVFIAGAVIQWLRDGLGFFKSASQTDSLIKGLKNSEGVVFVPAFTGLGAPYWRPDARGMISGLTRGTKKEHIIRAALEGVAHQTADILEAMRKGSSKRLKALKVDGGAVANQFLMQFQADLLQIPVFISGNHELTAWGAAKLAGRFSGFWNFKEERLKYETKFPSISASASAVFRRNWKREIARLLMDH